MKSKRIEIGAFGTKKRGAIVCIQGTKAKEMMDSVQEVLWNEGITKGDENHD